MIAKRTLEIDNMKKLYVLLLVVGLSGCATLEGGANRLGDIMGVNQTETYCEPYLYDFLNYINGRCE